MITDEKYKQVLDSGLLLDHYYLLCNLKNNVKLVTTKRIQGFINLLTKKEYIKDDVITQKGLDLVDGVVITEIPEVRVSSLVTDFDTWVNKLHEKCANTLEELTGKRQMVAKIKASSYYFLPTRPQDLAKPLVRAMKTYKLKDLEKIETVILAYVRKCAQTNSWFPLLKYYVMKDGESVMVNDLDSLDIDPDKEYKSNTKLL